MLLGNYSVYNKNPLRYFAGSTATPEVNHRANFNRGGYLKNRQYVEQTTAANKQFSLASGTYPPYVQVLPQKGGDVTARRSGDFSVSATATGLLIRLGEGSASFSITTNHPAGELISSGAGTASFSITVNHPLLTASINGAGSASFTFSGSLVRYAVGHMTGSAVPYTELSPQSLAAAVWDSALVDYQLDGSAGKSLSTASSGGVDLNLMAQAVWEYVSRTLTAGGGTAPTTAEIVDALETAVLPVNLTQVRGQSLSGSGSEADPWGP